MTTGYFLFFGLFCSALAFVHYLKGNTFRFVVNVVFALINAAEFFYWNK